MKNKLLALALAGFMVAPVVAAPDIGVSIGIHQPGVYGRVNIGSMPPPPLVYAQPVLVAPPRVAMQRQPTYLYVPPGHQRDWRKHCGRYNACGQPVYFVQERWVKERWQERRGPQGEARAHGGRGHPGKAYGHGKSRDRDDDRDHGRRHGRGKDH